MPTPDAVAPSPDQSPVVEWREVGEFFAAEGTLQDIRTTDPALTRGVEWLLDAAMQTFVNEGSSEEQARQQALAAARGAVAMTRYIDKSVAETLGGF